MDDVQSDTGSAGHALEDHDLIANDSSDGGKPLLLRPRLDPKPWGGYELARFGLALPANEPVGEAVVTAADATIRNGSLAGTTLGDAVAAAPLAIVGSRGLAVTGGRPLFPLLLKLIDAAENLSVQVHPDDAAARPDGRLGKTEAWHVLAATPGSALYLGLRPEVEGDAFVAVCRSGRGGAAALLRQVPAVPGTTVLIPAGTVHALGSDVMVYELQQPSDVTYRLDDWGRVDAAGRPREMHVEQGLAVIDLAARPELIPPVNLPTGAGRRQLLVRCGYFALERIALAAGEVVPIRAPGSPQTLTCLRGAAEVTAGSAVSLGLGETVVLPAAVPEGWLRASMPAVVLRAWVPEG